MGKRTLPGIAAAVAILSCVTAANAALQFDKNVTPDILFGSGVTNGKFTLNDAGDAVQLGLRARQRDPNDGTVNSNGNGTYSYPTGSGTLAFPRPLWNFDWSINTSPSAAGSSGISLDDLTYAIRMDYDPTAGTNYRTFDPINGNNPDSGLLLWDHGIGNNTTANGAGDNDAGRTVLTYAALIAGNNVGQNSWALSFYDDATHIIDPNLDGTYTIQLEAFRSGQSIGLTSIDVIVGAGSPVPEPASFVAWGLLACVFGGAASRRRTR